MIGENADRLQSHLSKRCQETLGQLLQESSLAAMGGHENTTELECDIWFELVKKFFCKRVYRGIANKTCIKNDVFGGERNADTSQATLLR